MNIGKVENPIAALLTKMGGLIPEIWGIWMKQGISILLAGQLINAREAHRFKLINQVVPRNELTQKCEYIAHQIKSFKASAIKSAKKAIINGMDMELRQGLELEAQLSIQTLLSL